MTTPTGPAPITWQNVRWQAYFTGTTDANGVLYPTFSPEFPNNIYGISASLDFSGGGRPWLLSLANVSRLGFWCIVSSAPAGAWAPIANTFVGIYYTAIGD